MTNDANSPEGIDLSGILHPGEKVLWRGRSVFRVAFEYVYPLEFIGMIFFIGLSFGWLFWTALAGPVWLLWAVFFSVGLWGLLGKHLWRAWRRRQSLYVLTDRRALIVSRGFGRQKVEAYQIAKGTKVQLVEGQPGSVHFATRKWRAMHGYEKRWRTGFDFIEDAAAVHALFRRVQGKA